MARQGGRGVSALRLARCGLAGEQAAVSVQALPAQDYAQKRHGDARLEAALYVLVCGYAPADGYEEEYIGG